MKRYSVKSNISRGESPQFLYNLTNNRNIHVIKVQSCHLSSSRSLKRQHTCGSEEYEVLTSHISISNCLINYSTTRRNSYVYWYIFSLYKSSQILYAIKIQSVIRRYLLQRKFLREEINRQEDRNVMLKEIVQKYMTNYDYPANNQELNRKLHEKIVKEINILVEVIKNPVV